MRRPFSSFLASSQAAAAAAAVLLLLLLLLHVPCHASAASAVTCRTTWGSGAAYDTLIELPPERVNDGYCDCLDTGADETETDACAGVTHWDGNTAAGADGR